MFKKPISLQFGGGSYLSKFGIDPESITNLESDIEIDVLEREISESECNDKQQEKSNNNAQKETSEKAINRNNKQKEKSNNKPKITNELKSEKVINSKSKRNNKTKAEPSKKKSKIQTDDNVLEESGILEESGSKYVKQCLETKILPITIDSIQKQVPECIPIGNEYKIGYDIFMSKSNLYKIEMSDYTLISDAPFDCADAPMALKPLLKKWVYKLHVSQTLSPIITRSVLRERVAGGQILAYRYTECSIAGNPCVYYGFIPTISKQFEDSTHNTCYIASVALWPRKLYVYLKRGYTCTCSEGCSMWSSRIDDYSTTKTFCSKNIKWGELYVMMGDFDETFVEIPKVFRSCEVCAQCFDCSKSARYCRKHKVCKHKTAKSLEDVLSIVGSAIKQCKKYT